MWKAEFTPSKGWLMARNAGQMPRRPSWSDSEAFVLAAVPPLGEGSVFGTAGEGRDARAIAYSGLAALFALPVLLLASVLLGVPLAAPAAIALGYLASSYALASDRPRSAAAINGVVLVGLVVWAAGMLVTGDGISRIAVATALVSPLFAAAPALARLLLAPRTDRATSVAQRDTACLDRLAPKEAVLVVQRDGALLAATRAARATLGLPAEARGADVSRFIALMDRPKLTDAIARCRPGAEPAEIIVRGESGGRRGQATCFTAQVTADDENVVSIRLTVGDAVRRAKVVTLSRPRTRKRGSGLAAGPVCEVREAVDFALRHAAPIAEARGVLLFANVEAGVTARCERQIGRRILCLMVECALNGSSGGDVFHLTGRAMKSVTLLRLAGGRIRDGEQQRGNTGAQEACAALRRLVDEAGGTLVVDESAGEMRVSVRLEPAVAQAQELRDLREVG